MSRVIAAVVLVAAVLFILWLSALTADSVEFTSYLLERIDDGTVEVVDHFDY